MQPYRISPYWIYPLSISFLGLSAITFFNNLIGQAGQKLTYDFELLDDIDYSGDDQATGTVKISAELPVVGLQSTQTKFSFLMEDGEWYISGVDIV